MINQIHILFILNLYIFIFSLFTQTQRIKNRGVQEYNFINNSGMKNHYNDEEIVDDDDEDGQMPQIPKTLEKKIPQMNKYFNDRSRTQSDSATSAYQSFQSLLTQKSIIDKEKRQKLQKQDQDIVSEEQVQLKKCQQNLQQEQGDKEENKELSTELKQEESKKIIMKENHKCQEEEKTQIPELDPLQFPYSTPQKDIIASNNIFSSQNYHPIFDTPSDTDQSFSKQAIQNPTQQNQQKSDLIQTESQLSIAKQRINTESTQSSITSQIFTVFQIPSHSINGNNQYGSNINILSNSSFNSANNDHNTSCASTKPSVNQTFHKIQLKIKDSSINESYTRQEIEEIAIKIKKLPIKERKQKELSIIKYWNQDKHQNSHIIDISWTIQYTKWFANNNVTQPFNLPISNMNLVDIANRKLKYGLKESIHFDVLAYKAYLLMKSLYGGGPDIPLKKQRSMNDIVQNNNHSKISLYGGDGHLAKQTSSASTAPTTNPSLIESNIRSQNKIPLQFLDNQVINQQTVVVHPSRMYRRVQLPVKGLHNQSNYCYLNASIQCFLSIPELNCYFLNFSNEEYRRVIQYQNTRKPIRLVPVYSDMVKHYEKTSDRSILDMNQLKKAIRKPFIPHEQHDAQELIRYILSEIQDELNPVLPQKNPTQFEDPEIAYKYYLKYQNSQLSSCVNCSKCGYASKTFDPFLDLSLGMDSKVQTVQDCMNKFFQEEILSDDYKCEKCNQNNKAKKQVFISKTPYILTLHLKRFKIYPKKKKISDFVKYPISNLSIKQYLKGSGCGGYYYNLIGIIVHSGNQDSGHYVSYIKRENRWFCCDDGRFQEESEKTVLKQEAYLLFYQRIEQSSDLSQVKRIQQQ